MLYRTPSEEHPIHVILGDASLQESARRSCCWRNNVWLGHSWWNGLLRYQVHVHEIGHWVWEDVLGVEDWREDEPLTVCAEFQENINKWGDGRYEVSIAWIPGAVFLNMNEKPSRRRLCSVEWRLHQNNELRKEYKKIVWEQLDQGIVEDTRKFD